MKKVLIAIGDLGSCHRIAAIALEQVFDEKYPDIEYKTVDIYTHDFKVKRENLSILDKISIKIFDHFGNNENYEQQSKSRIQSKISEVVFFLANYFPGYQVYKMICNRGKLFEFESVVKEYNPDIIVSIHPITTLYASQLKRKYDFKFVNIVVDLMTTPSSWFVDNADIYISASNEAAKQLKRRRVDNDKIYSPLFPVKPAFANLKPRHEVLLSLGLSPDLKTILLYGGGSGIYSALSHLNKIIDKKDQQIIIVTGKTKDLKEKLTEKYKDYPQVKVLGFVKDAHDLLSVVDVVITKPGTATVIELEVLNKKALISHYIGGQELGNVWYLKKNPNFIYYGDKLFGFNQALKELDNRQPLIKPKRSVDEVYKIAELINNV
jgi:UDP-N-acetylglucosamine:LPS N-acetylglucosamine transferase